MAVNPPASLDTKRVSGGLRSRVLFLALKEEEEQRPKFSAKAHGVEGNSGCSQTQSLPRRQERSNALPRDRGSFHGNLPQKSCSCGRV